MVKYKVGDKVKLINTKVDDIYVTNTHLLIGSRGVVVLTRMFYDGQYYIGVDWGKDFINGHTCDSHCRHPQGWCVPINNIQHINEPNINEPNIIKSLRLPILNKLEKYYN